MTATENETTTVNVTINGNEIQANPGELLIDAAERHGTYIPRFCYHSRMKPVGMCRMCLVEVDSGRGPALQPSCMIPVSEGMTVDTESDATKKAQDGVLEFLLINHPLDCPVCDKGGECPLQDQTVAYGPGESRFVEEKRHYESRSRSATPSTSTASAASCVIVARGSPTTLPATPSSISWTAGTAPRSTPFLTNLLPPTSRATPSRSAQSVLSRRSRTVSRPAPGISRRRSPPPGPTRSDPE